MVSKVEHKHRTGCPIACILDVIGDHWTLLIVRNLMFTGLHEYKDMLNAEEKISSSILTSRLKKLEEGGLIAFAPHPQSQRRKLYYLTAKGKDLVHAMVSMILWANKHLDQHLAIPDYKKYQLENDPEQFIRDTLETLELWERENLPVRTVFEPEMISPL